MAESDYQRASSSASSSATSPTKYASDKPRLSQGYAYACQRAELLGLRTPTEAEYLSSDDYALERQVVEQEAHDDAVAQELNENDESMGRIAGGLDELNVILNATQKKINKFKNVCGSLGTLLKARVSSSSPGTPEHKPRAGTSSEPYNENDDELTTGNPNEQQNEINDDDDDEQTTRATNITSRKIDLNEKVGSHLDKLDSLINKAENAQYSMKHQTKQMKAYMK